MARYALTRPGAGIALLAASVAACTEQRFPLGFEADITSPTVQVVKTAGDTINVADGIKFSIRARDNLGLKNITLNLTGALTLTQDTTFRTAVTEVELPVDIQLPSGTVVGGTVVIRATATDGRGNSASVTDSVFLLNLAALTVTVTQPPPGQVTGPGVQLPIQVKAVQASGVRRVGYTVSGVVTAADSASFPLPDTAIFNDTLLVPVGTPAGDFFIQGFAVDSASRRASSSVVTVTVQQALVDTIPPRVSFTVAKRVEVGDTITVTASDPSGIVRLGWIARDTTAAGNVVAGDSFSLATPISPASRSFRLTLPQSILGQAIRIGAFAVDGAGNRGEARLATDTTVVRQDTVLAVFGVTRALPQGGRIADAIYNPNRNEVYLTNIANDRLEVFRIADTSFGSPGVLARGSQPWGIALWPRDTVTGANADTVVVANSGGTNLSIVNVAVSPPREVRRHALPVFRVFKVKTVINDAGFPEPEITEYHFDDRPQYVGTVCRGGDCTAGGGGDVIAVYSTTPTRGQSEPFPRRASLRWEKLTNLATPESHFFWEHAGVQATSQSSDTLGIVVRRGGVETELLSYLCGRIVTITELGFLDTTFVRNSGNFARVLVGEGGRGDPPLVFARALTFDVNVGVTATCVDTSGTARPLNLDNGVSPDLEVRNFITNTAASVKSIATNFNGTTNLIRADSIYVIDRFLRLQGIIPVGGTNFGMDLNFNHNFDAKDELSPTGVSPNERIVFAASAQATIDVYDTYFYSKITSIPIRDPITGPLRVAKLPSGEQILVGVTARGVVTVRLPAITNPFQAAGR
ncbi:hypothetical protein HRbin33_01232 [bacterium HR33]|nr:hypothetical protein HRbin33_01232 [bacterium HR33]